MDNSSDNEIVVESSVQEDEHMEASEEAINYATPTPPIDPGVEVLHSSASTPSKNRLEIGCVGKPVTVASPSQPTLREGEIVTTYDPSDSFVSVVSDCIAKRDANR